ncbi:MAG: hypothetical protein IPK80_14210 [Nannocystis sp.]|nr:hypothetical protein [Nannocystis sp.]
MNPGLISLLESLESMVYGLGFVAAVGGYAVTNLLQLRQLYLRGNPYPGLLRLARALGTLYIAYVLAFHADESVDLEYGVYYLVLGWGFIAVYGHGVGALLLGRPLRLISERRNPAVAYVYSALLLATAMLFGSSLWGDADAVGDDIGGWWIPVGFFLSGWVSLLLALGLFIAEEGGRTWRTRIRLDHDRRLGLSTANFLLSAAWVLSEAVAGDFYGWQQGLTSVLAVTAMLLTHAIIRRISRGVRGMLLLELALYALAVWLTPRIAAYINGPA